MTAPVWFSQGEEHLPAGLDWLGPHERARADGMRFTKRRDEFLVSRWTAKNAVLLSTPSSADPLTAQDVEILPAHDGAPVPHLRGVPWTRRLSMTDRAGWAVCLVSASATEVGCDLELVEPRSAAFVGDYLTPAEQAVVGAAHDDEDLALRANLVWSAKESALKVLRTGLRRATRSVEVTVDPDAAAPGEWAPLEVRPVEGGVFPGWWVRHGSFVLTVCAAADIPAPRALVEPPALAAAVPAHTWVDRPTR